MVTVKRANVVLTVEDDEVEKYFQKGYSIIDKFGNVIKASVPTEVGALQKALQDKEVEITELKKKIEKLQSENVVLSKVLTTPSEKKSSYKKKTVEEQ